MRGLPILAAVLIAGIAGAQSPEDKAGKVAFESVCGACHPAAMAEDLRSLAEWKETVDLMLMAGAKATREQLDRIIRFLERNWTRININSATAAEIAPVLGVSDATAQAIVKQRTAAGPFKSLDELKKIPGVDAAKLDARKDRIAF